MDRAQRGFELGLVARLGARSSGMADSPEGGTDGSSDDRSEGSSDGGPAGEAAGAGRSSRSTSPRSSSRCSRSSVRAPHCARNSSADTRPLHRISSARVAASRSALRCCSSARPRSLLP
ncbi:MAG: hypothetical protein U1F56_16185 [Rubrivivax sp.]